MTNLETARKLKSPTDPPDTSLDEHEKEIRKSYDKLYAADPELKQFASVATKP